MKLKLIKNGNFSYGTIIYGVEKKNPTGTYSQWKSPKTTLVNKVGTSSNAKTAKPAATPTVKPKLNFTAQLVQAQKLNPNLTSQEFEKTFNQQQGGAESLKAAKLKNAQTAQSNLVNSQSSGKKVLKQNADYVQNTQSMLPKQVEINQDNVFDTATIPDPVAPETQDLNQPQEPLAQVPEMQPLQPLETEIPETPEIPDFASQLTEQQDQVSQLVNSLNTKQAGLGDTVNEVLQEMAQNGVKAQLTPETYKMIEEIAATTPPDQIDDKIAEMQSQPAPEPVQPVQEVNAELQAPYVLPKQQYAELKKSGMNAGQIVQQDPNMMSQVIPDGSILNPGAGVGIIQTPTGDAYKTPSGLVIPKDPSTGFYNLSALTPDQITKMSFADLMSIDLATQKTTSDMKAFYNATTFQQMAARNEREYGIAQIDLQSFYNSENNRLNESQLKASQQIEIEKMRQELSRDTSIQQLNQAKGKASAMMKAQMDAWGLEGSSVMISAQIAQSSKFEQEISNVTKSYDINVMELTMASTQTQMEFTNRVTELNQKMQTQKMSLTSDYLNKKDEIDNSVLMSKIAQADEQNNMYRDYAMKIYDNEQAAQAAMAEAEKEAKAETWEKQKYYGEQLGFLVEVDAEGKPTPLLGNDGNPVPTIAGRTSDRADIQLEFDQVKFEEDIRQFDLNYALAEQAQSFGQDFDIMQFQRDVEEFDINYALQAQGQSFNQEMDLMNYNQKDQQFYDNLNSFDSIEFDEAAGTWLGKSAGGGIVDLGADYGNLAVAVPTKGAYKFNVEGGAVRFDVPTGVPDPASKEKQCGSFVNFALWGEGNHFGNSIETDIQKYSNSPVPVAGGAFMERVGGVPGHKGMVEKVNKDAQGNIVSIEIIEQNWQQNAQGQGIVTRATIPAGSTRWNRMFDAGFYDPTKDGTSKKNTPAGGAPAGNGEYAKMVQANLAAGMDQKTAKEVATTQFKSQSAGLNEAQGASYNALIQANQENTLYKSYMSKVDPEEFADNMDVINRKITDLSSPITAQTLNNLKVPKDVQAAIMSETRWIQAILRKESGAAISAEEYMTMGNALFPRKGDSSQTIADKEKARLLKEEGLKQQAGPAGMKAFEETMKKIGSTTPPVSSTKKLSANDPSYSSKKSTLYKKTKPSSRYKLPPALGGSDPSSGYNINF